MPDIFVSPKEEKVLHRKPLCRNTGRTDRRIFSSFRYCPDGVSFVNKSPKEMVVLITRRHFATNIRWIFIFIVMLFMPAALVIFPILSFMPDAYQLVSVIIWYMVTVAFGFEQFLAWFFNVSIITNDRIIDVNFANLIYREITEADLQQIQDVKVQVGSVARTVLKYGDVVVQTASETQNIVFEAVPDPDAVAKIIREQREQGEI